MAIKPADTSFNEERVYDTVNKKPIPVLNKRNCSHTHHMAISGGCYACIAAVLLIVLGALLFFISDDSKTRDAGLGIIGGVVVSAIFGFIMWCICHEEHA